MKYRKLGTSDLNVSVMAFGAWQLADSDYWGQAEHGDEAVRAALDAGINLFDTAEAYAQGTSEQALGRALGADRDKVLIASKLTPDHCTAELVRSSCEASLERLGTDRIDLYQVHWPPPKERFSETAEALLKLKQEGKIRHIGLSNFGPKNIESWVSAGEAISDQLGYNMLFRAIEHEITPACVKHGLGILVYMPLMQGLLTGRWKTVEDIPGSRRRTRHFAGSREGVRHGESGVEDLLMDTAQQIQAVAEALHQPPANVAIAWTLARPGVSSVIVGGRKPEQVTRNIAACELKLGAGVIDRLDVITEPLKERLGSNADMWQGKEDSRIR